MKTIRALVLSLVVLAISVPAFATPCRHARAKTKTVVAYANPDGRTSITLTGALGSLDGLSAGRDADLRTLGVALVYPAYRDISFLARYDHSNAEWNGATPRHGLSDFDTDLFTVGVRFYLGR